MCVYIILVYNLESILPGQKDPYVSDRLLYIAYLQLNNSDREVIFDAVYEGGIFNVNSS